MSENKKTPAIALAPGLGVSVLLAETKSLETTLESRN